MLISSKWMSHDLWSCPCFWLADFLSNSSMAQTKKTPRIGKGKGALQVRTRVEMHSEQGPPVLVDSQCQRWKPPNLEWIGEESRGGWEVGRGGEVTRVVANPTVCLDDCRGQAIYVGLQGAGQEEALTNCGRQGPLEGIPPGQKSEGCPRGTDQDRGSLQDLLIPE